MGILRLPIFQSVLSDFSHLAVVLHDKGSLRVHSIVAEFPPVLLGEGVEGERFCLTLDFDGNPAIDGVRKAPHFLGIPAEAQRRQRWPALVVPYHRIRVTGQADALFLVVVGHHHKFWLAHT